jgi:hypothetical protein
MTLLSLAVTFLAIQCPEPVQQECPHTGESGASGAEATHVVAADSGTGVLGGATQLTFGEQFVKAGESYISPDGTKVIFQAVAVPADGGEPDEHYAMYLGDLVHDKGSWRLDNVRVLTPEGSANTCGWFHPTDPSKVIFASTVTEPGGGDVPGYQRGSGKYKWSYPPRMRIVEARIDGDFPPPITLLEGDESAYQAECSISPDGRHLLYTSHETGDGDIYIRDLKTGKRHLVVGAPGYDGGPFFSPDGTRITYRSDRNKDNLLQVFVGELAFDEHGTMVGLEEEIQLTNNEHVNWAPFWHPDDAHLVYATSEAGHDNYEVYEIEAARGGGVGKPARYGTGKRRITNVAGFDGLPAFDPTGQLMIWTSQQGGDGSQLWIAPFGSGEGAAKTGECPVAH